MPPIVRMLGYAGLFPFVGLALYCIIEPSANLAKQALGVYAFGILSFLCGTWWPLQDMRGASRIPFLLSNAVFLVAFFAFMAVPDYWLHTSAVLFLVVLLLERNAILSASVSQQYRRLRIVLTTVAMLSLLSAGLLTP